jgi:vacuolar-type H+-ATPase subunit F/Vma7
MSDAHLMVVTPDEMAPGFRLAGVAVRAVADADEAVRAVADIIATGERGVIAVYEPYLAQVDAAQRVHWESSLSPVIISLPAGLGAEPAAHRRNRLAGLIQRAVGYHITFGEDA